MSSDLSPLFPAKLQAVFPRRVCGSAPDLFAWPGNAGYVASVNFSSITFSDTSVNPAPQGVSGTTLTLRDTAQARFNAPAPNPTNQAALDALARQLFQDWCDWQSQSIDLVYNGIVNPLPNALIDVAEFCYTADDQWTRVQSAAWSSDPVEYAHFDPTIADPACQQSWDRGPDTMFLGPGTSVASGSTTLVRDVLSLEDGRLVGKYDSQETVNCGCAPTTQFCGQICVAVNGCSNLNVNGSRVTITQGTTTIGNDTVSTKVISISFTNPGQGYITVPNVVISSASGSGAQAVATVGTIGVRLVTVTSGGDGYTIQPGLSFNGGGGSGAIGNVLLTATTVASISVTANGSNYTSVPGVSLVTISGFTGSGATAAAVMQLASIASITNGGSGYTVGDVLTISGGIFTTAAMLTVTSTSLGVITGVSLNAAGSYTTLPANPISVTGGTGLGATFSVRWNVQSISVTSGGSNYNRQPNVSITGGGGSGALGTSFLTATSVASISLTSNGSGYTSAPAVNFSGGGGGSGAAATAIIGGALASITLVFHGSGYVIGTPVTVTIDPPPASSIAVQALANASLASRACVSITGSGTYTANVLPPPGVPWWNTAPITQGAIVTNCSSGASTSVTLAVLPGSNGYSCKCLNCADPLPNTATLTDSRQTITLTWGGSNYAGSYTLANQEVYQCGSGPGRIFCISPLIRSNNSNIIVGYVLSCPSINSPWQLHMQINSTCTDSDGIERLADSVSCFPSAIDVLGNTQAAPSNCNTPLAFNTSTSPFYGGTVAVSFP